VGAIQDKIRSDTRGCLKSGDKVGVGNRKVIIGEFQRQKKKELSDDEEIKVLKSLEKSAIENLKTSDDTSYIDTIRIYLPTMVTEDEIKQWITDNVNFSELKSPMQAVGLTMKEFGAKADGKEVKRIITEMI